SLVGGNFMYIFNYMIGCAKKEHYSLIKYVFFIPLYWILASVAAFKAAQQLIFKPHFWEKTHHGLHLADTKKKSQQQKTEKERLWIPGWLEGRLTANGNFNLHYSRAKTFLRTGGIGVVLLVGSSVFANFLDFLTSSYLGRNLGSEEFGLIGLMGSFMFIVSLISSGVNKTISHQTAFVFGKYGSPVGKLWYEHRPKVLKVSLVFTLMWILIVPFTENFFNSHTLFPFIVFTPVWAILMLRAWDGGYLEGGLKFVWLAVLTSVTASSKLIFSVAFVTSGAEQLVYAAGPLSLFVGLCGGWIVARKVANRNLSSKTAPSKISMKFSKRFLATATMTKISSISFLSLDLIFVKHFLSASEAGQYALLVLVGRIIYIVGGFSSQFILPVISKEKGQGVKQSRTSTLIMLSVIASTLLAFFMVGPLGFLVVPLMFGENALPIIPYLTPFAMAMVLFTVAYSLVTYHQARKEYAFAFTGIMTATVQFVCLFLFHANIGQVVAGMFVSGAFFLVTTLVMHIRYDDIKHILSNLTDFWDLIIRPKKNFTEITENPRLNILIYNWRDTKHVWAGGAEVYVHELAKRWVAEGNNVTIFCGNDGENERHEIIDGVSVIRRGGLYTVYLWAVLYYLLRLRGKYDLIVDSENSMPFFTPLFARIPKIGLIHHVHSDIILKELKLPITRIPAAVVAKYVESTLMPVLYRNVQMVTVSESSKKDMEKLGFGKNKPIQIINPGIDLDVLKPGPKSKEPTLLYLGRLKPYKSIDTLIKAADELRETIPNLKVKIAGFGESRKDLERLTKKLGLQKYVEFLGRVSETDKVRLLGEAWVFVQPSTFEGWGISVLEANACGTPIVASRVPGLIDSVKNPSTGYTVKVKDEKAFAKAIAKLLNDNDLREKFSDNSIKWAEQFNWEVKSQEFMKLIEFEITANNLPLMYSETMSTNNNEID
ncbi:MAG TPA: glycosyltransferase, partial [Niabella sp.]|nr:glycosyltransferase [Niabella sp.]